MRSGGGKKRGAFVLLVTIIDYDMRAGAHHGCNEE